MPRQAGIVTARGIVHLTENELAQLALPGMMVSQTQGATVQSGAGSAAGSSSVSGVGASKFLGVGTAAGSSTAQGVAPGILLDGVSHAAMTPDATSMSVTLSTTLTNDIVVVVNHWFCSVSNYSAQNGPPFVSTIADTAGLQWHIRTFAEQISTGWSSFQHFVTVWWAYAPTALVSDVITVTPIHTGTTYGEILAFGANGVDWTYPWDNNSSLPAISAVNTGGSSSHPVTGISTNNAQVMQLNILAELHGGSGMLANDSGFQNLSQDYGSATYSGMFVEYQNLSATLSGATQDVWASQSTTIDYIAIVDFLRMAPPSELGTPWSGPAYVNSGAISVVDAATITPALPANIVAGNLLIATASITSGTASPSWSAGWTVIETWNATAGGNTQTGSKAWRLATGSDTSPTITWTGTTGAMACVHQVTGNDTVNPIGASAHNSQQSTTISVTPLTTTKPNSLVINFIDLGQTYNLTPPAPYLGGTSGGTNTPAYGCGTLFYENIASSGVTADAISISNYQAVNTQWLDFMTEILAPYYHPGSGQAAALMIGV